LLISIPGLVCEEDLAAIRSAMGNGPFEPGKPTAFGTAARAKNNLQLDERSPAAREARDRLIRIVRAHAGFQTATWIATMAGPMFCRYDEGMEYGDHVDSPIMGDGLVRMRCDLAVTVLLTGRSEYDGGELVIDVDGSPHQWKGGAGDCIIYPADTLHRVERVTRGVRLAAVLWIQTLVRDAGKRKLLFELAGAVRDLDATLTGSASWERIRRSYTNLIRMWAEPPERPDT
jgi:PKHD-type hydroxylase